MGEDSDTIGVGDIVEAVWGTIGYVIDSYREHVVYKVIKIGKNGGTITADIGDIVTVQVCFCHKVDYSKLKNMLKW